VDPIKEPVPVQPTAHYAMGGVPTTNETEVIIDGEVTGSVSCQKLTLKKRATLDGDLEVASLSVEEGARHTGNVKMKS
jgi:cytoskeletal protein CcmA (bactofilin family)